MMIFMKYAVIFYDHTGKVAEIMGPQSRFGAKWDAEYYTARTKKYARAVVVRIIGETRML